MTHACHLLWKVDPVTYLFRGTGGGQSADICGDVVDGAAGCNVSGVSVGQSLVSHLQ